MEFNIKILILLLSFLNVRDLKLNFEISYFKHGEKYSNLKSVEHL